MYDFNMHMEECTRFHRENVFLPMSTAYDTTARKQRTMQEMREKKLIGIKMLCGL